MKGLYDESMDFLHIQLGLLTQSKANSDNKNSFEGNTQNISRNFQRQDIEKPKWC